MFLISKPSIFHYCCWRNCLVDVARIDLSLLLIATKWTSRSSFFVCYLEQSTSTMRGHSLHFRLKCRDTPLFTFWHCIYVIYLINAHFFSLVVFCLKSDQTHDQSGWKCKFRLVWNWLLDSKVFELWLLF